jgi:hypothetical protein
LLPLTPEPDALCIQICVKRWRGCAMRAARLCHATDVADSRSLFQACRSDACGLEKQIALFYCPTDGSRRSRHAFPCKDLPTSSLRLRAIGHPEPIFLSHSAIRNIGFKNIEAVEGPTLSVEPKASVGLMRISGALSMEFNIRVLRTSVPNTERILRRGTFQSLDNLASPT